MRGQACAASAWPGPWACKSPPFHAMLVSLQAMGLVRKSDYGSAFFTPQGRALADRYHRYFQAVRGMLESRFPRCPALDDAACALLAALPPESLERFCAGPPIPKGEL